METLTTFDPAEHANIGDCQSPAAAKLRGFSQHERSPDGKDEWLTPPEIIAALGTFDLDPFCAIDMPWPTAKKHLTIHSDGLKTPWGDSSVRVWMNPPYGSVTPKAMKKLAQHGNGIALIFARTETGSFFPWVWHYADAIFFFDARLKFYHVTGEQAEQGAGAPSCLVAYGDYNVERIHAAQKNGLISGFLLPIP